MNSVTFAAKLQAGMISKGRLAVTSRVNILKYSIKARVALVAAVLLTLHSLVVCAATVPECVPSSLHTPLHQEEGCPHHQHHGSRQSHGCTCCESVLCEARVELTRSDSRSTIEGAVFVPLFTATLLVNSAVASLRGASEPPLNLPPRFFLIQRTLLI